MREGLESVSGSPGTSALLAPRGLTAPRVVVRILWSNCISRFAESLRTGPKRDLSAKGGAGIEASLFSGEPVDMLVLVRALQRFENFTVTPSDTGETQGSNARQPLRSSDPSKASHEKNKQEQN